MNPKVSVIISTRNRTKLLMERALPSVLKQTCRDFEVIIIDDASDDDSWIKNTIENIRYFKNNERKGLAHNRNLGAEMARGEYIVNLDDDNEFHPTFLEETIKYLDEHQYISVVGVGKVVIYPEGRVYHAPPKGTHSINDGFLMRKEAFLEVKCDETLTANEDADFGFRFTKKFHNGQIDKPLMTVYGSAIINTTSYSGYDDYHLTGMLQFWLKNKDNFNEKDRQYYQKMIGRMFLLAAGRPKWFKSLYILEEKLKRYYQIWYTYFFNNTWE